jgi:hypothetical protein
MKTIKTNLTLIMFLIIFGSYAQKTNDKIDIPLNSINTVVLSELSGVCSIFQSKTNELYARSELNTSGGKWGWSFPKERPLFKISSRESNDTLYVEMPYEFSFKTIGISTYSEHITSIIQIPEDKQIIIQKANKLIVEDEFSQLNIQNTEDLICNIIHKNSMNNILCNAGKRLTINGLKSNNQYEFQGSGKGNSSLKAINISLTLK